MKSTLIAEKYIPKKELLKVANAVLNAQDIREDSWNGLIYQRRNESAASEAVVKNKLSIFWKNIIYEWNQYNWNEIQTWAEEIIKKLH